MPHAPFQNRRDLNRELEADARAELRMSAYASVRRVSCELQDGAIILRGCVPSYFLKQIAQSALIERLNGVVRIDNRLEVIPRVASRIKEKVGRNEN